MDSDTTDERPDRGSESRADRDVHDMDRRWEAANVRRLRAHLGLSQADMAERIGTRQQTISEWETGARAPRRMARRLLGLVAETSGFYAVPAPADPPPPGDML